jgi:hypothetical protein
MVVDYRNYDKRIRRLAGTKHLGLIMPHDMFVEFTNQFKDGECVDLFFVDEETRDLYTPVDKVKMMYFYNTLNVASIEEE